MERRILLSHGWGMGDSDVREREGRSRRAGSPVSDLVASKLRRPLVRGGTVSRSVLMERLARGDRRPIVSVVAPPGYGKTTVLSQWAEHNGQAFAWVSVDERDNDPKVLLTYLSPWPSGPCWRSPGVHGRRASASCPRPGRWPATLIWRITRWSRSCTRRPRGWRCTKPTGRAPLRN